jgi:metallo-beta-lactamase family protein
MLRDSGRIQESDADYINRRNARHGRQEAPVEPLYTEADAEAALKQFRGQDYKRPFAVAPGVTATYYDAGHMLGSASVVLDIEEKGGGCVGLSGDTPHEPADLARPRCARWITPSWINLRRA